MSEDVQWNGDEFQKEVDNIIRGKLVALFRKYERIFVELIRAAKHGLLYRRRSVTHRASAPGEPPANDTGFLMHSPGKQIYKLSEDEWALDLGPSKESGRAEIAEWLEFGTSRIKPRPAWRPALDRLANEAEKAMKEEATGASR